MCRLDQPEKLDCEVAIKLTGLNVSGLTNLKDLRCKNNPYTFFKIAEGKTLTVTSAAGGTVWMTAFNKNTGEVTLEARPDTGYTFKRVAACLMAFPLPQQPTLPEHGYDRGGWVRQHGRDAKEPVPIRWDAGPGL